MTPKISVILAILVLINACAAPSKMKVNYDSTEV